MSRSLSVVGHVVKRSWQTERGVLLRTWIAVTLLVVPLLGVTVFAFMLRRVWENTSPGTYVWTKSDSVSRGHPIAGPGCELLLDPEGVRQYQRSTWVIPASLWSAMGWEVHWLQQSASPSALLIVPPPRGAFHTHRTVGGQRHIVAGLVRAPNINVTFQPADAFLLVRDSAAVASTCGPQLGVLRLFDSPPSELSGVSAYASKVIATPGGLAYSNWITVRRALIGIVIGSLVALIVVTAGAAHFWAAGEAPAWAIARLVGCPWPLLRWQVAVETCWLLGPGLLAGTLAVYAIFEGVSRWWNFSVAPVGFIFAVAVGVLLILGLTLGSILYGRMRRLNPMDGLREAREWHG